LPDNKNNYLGMVVDSAIRLLVLGLLLYFCLQITKPFLLILVWAAIVAIAVYPLFLKLLSLFGGRKGWTSTFMVLLTLVVLTVPVVQITGSIIDTARSVSADIESGSLDIPPPADGVKEWPIIGEPLHEAWSLASTSLEKAIKQYSDQVKSLTQSMIGLIGGFGGALFTFIFATIFAGVFLANAEGGYQFSVRLMTRLAGQDGHTLAHLAIQTIRSVAQGVIGVALIQALMAGLGLMMLDIPAIGLWVTLVLVLAIAQLPPIIVLGPIMVWVFSTHETTPAVLFMIYGIFVSASDSFLKPMFLGRGMDIPMPVILLGAIGGMLYAGIIGLFIGAIVLAFGYNLFTGWLEINDAEPGADGG
jgi:predicted PurR-regulated permease PerM